TAPPLDGLPELYASPGGAVWGITARTRVPTATALRPRTGPRSSPRRRTSRRSPGPCRSARALGSAPFAPLPPPTPTDRSRPSARSCASKGPSRFVASPACADRDRRHPVRPRDRTARRLGIGAEKRPGLDRYALALDPVAAGAADDDVDLVLRGVALVVLATL